MNIILYDDPVLRTRLLPLSFVRPVSEIRIGILKISEKWQLISGSEVSFLTEEYLQPKFKATTTKDNILINGSICPTEELWSAVSKLQTDQKLVSGGLTIAARLKSSLDYPFVTEGLESVDCNYDFDQIQFTWDVFRFNSSQIESDFIQLTKTRPTEPITDVHTKVYNEAQIHVGKGVKMRAAILNAEDGPIFIGDNAEIQEGAIIKGPVAICNNSVVNMGAKIRPGTTVGPYSKVGGEINNSVIFGYSNKAHDGFLGNSVIAEWCNIGADTNTSNLKNNYAEVKLWNYETQRFQKTGLQFCGLIMGDHAKTGINTMLNTGTVVGIGANIFGEGFPRNFIPSFSWGGASGFTDFKLSKFLEIAEIVMARRDTTLSEVDLAMYKHLYNLTENSRSRL